MKTAAPIRSEFAEVSEEATAQGLNAACLLESASRRFPNDPARIIAAMRAGIAKAAECDNLPSEPEAKAAQPRQVSAAEKAIQSALAMMAYLPKMGIKTAEGRELSETTQARGTANLKNALSGEGPEVERVALAIIGDIVELFKACRSLPAPKYLQKSDVENAVEVWKTPKQIRQSIQKAKAEVEAERRVKGDNSIQTIQLNASPFSRQDGEFCLNGWTRGEDMAVSEVPKNWKVWHRREEKTANAADFATYAEELA